MIRLKPFSRLSRFSTQTVDIAADALHAFHGESATEPVRPAPSAKRASKPRRLVLVLAVLAAMESVPAGLWLYQQYQAFRPTALAPPAVTTVAAASVVPLELPKAEPAAPPVTAPPIAAQETTRRTASTASTSKPASAAPPGTLGGNIEVSAPVPMRIYSRGRMVGTTEAETIMLPVGSHQLTFVSEETGYNATRTVKVEAGRTTPIRLDPPSGMVNVNASPWAEVWIGNKRIGDTPMGNLQLPIGAHEFVFRHPEFGERRKTALVTLKQPVRVSIDMRTK
jgi:PEGA domain